MAGFFNGSILVADNVDFSGGYPPTNGVTTNGQLLIGSTAAPHIRPGSLTSSGGTVTITTGAGTINLEAAATGGQPITDYVVDPAGGGDYTTVQAAVTQANSDGGGSVWIRPGTYTEDLTLYSGVDLVGACADDALGGDSVTIVGTHTLPTSGTLELRNVIFGDNTESVFTTATAGTTDITITNCTLNVASASYYLLDIANWTGTVTLERLIIASGARARTVNMVDNSGTLIMRNCHDLNDFTVSTPSQSVLSCIVNISNCSNINTVMTSSGGSLVSTNSNFYRLLSAGNDVDCFNCSMSIGCSANGGTGNFYGCTFTNSVVTPVNLDGSESAGTHSFFGCQFVCGASGANTSALRTSLISNAPTVYLYGCSLISGSGATYGIKIGSGSGGATVNLSGCDFVNSSAIENGIVTNFVGGIKGGGFAWTTVSGTSATMQSSSGYISDNGSLVTLTLPAVSKVGDTIKITGKGAGGWRVAQGAGQSINVGANTSTTGATGHIDSTNAADGVEMICITEDVTWNVIGFVGTIAAT